MAVILNKRVDTTHPTIHPRMRRTEECHSATPCAVRAPPSSLESIRPHLSPPNCRLRACKSPPAPGHLHWPRSPRPERSAAAASPSVGRWSPPDTPARPRSPHVASAHHAHDEVRAQLGIGTIRFNRARFGKRVGGARGARLVGGRSWVPSEVDRTRCGVDDRGNDYVVLPRLHCVAGQLLASVNREALKLAARTEGTGIEAYKRAGGDCVGRKKSRLLKCGASKRTLLDANPRRRDIQPTATGRVRREQRIAIRILIAVDQVEYNGPRGRHTGAG
eukprot:scaffold19198_cov68-Phaeocystis_antarctica.AAC.2